MTTCGVRPFNQHWPRNRLVAFQALRYHLTIIFNLTFTNKHMDNFITNLNVFIEINILQIQPAKWRPFRSGLNIKFTSFNIQQISILLIYIWSNQTRVFKKKTYFVNRTITFLCIQKRQSIWMVFRHFKWHSYKLSMYSKFPNVITEN